ncbi:MAG TPA: hypothetical protein DF699_11880, partial [Phycisphaerales bacterium]|nr:hypothetical protein [Phycisphaerales bacterium]
MDGPRCGACKGVRDVIPSREYLPAEGDTYRIAGRFGVLRKDGDDERHASSDRNGDTGDDHAPCGASVWWGGDACCELGRGGSKEAETEPAGVKASSKTRSETSGKACVKTCLKTCIKTSYSTRFTARFSPDLEADAFQGTNAAGHAKP